MTRPRPLAEMLDRALEAPTLARFAELAGLVMTDLLKAWGEQQRGARLEARVVAALDASRSPWVSLTALHRALGGHIIAAQLERALERLQATGTVLCRVEESRGRPRTLYFLRAESGEKPGSAPKKAKQIDSARRMSDGGSAEAY